MPTLNVYKILAVAIAILAGVIFSFGLTNTLLLGILVALLV